MLLLSHYTAKERTKFTLDALQRGWRKDEIYLVDMLEASNWEDGNGHTFTITCTNRALHYVEAGLPATKPEYATDVLVFDDKGKCVDGLGFDRVESVSRWRPTASSDELIAVRTFVDGTTYCRLSREGTLDVLIWSASMNPIVVEGRQSDSYLMVVPLKANNQVGYRTERGTAVLLDASLADHRPISSLGEGVIIIPFGGKEWRKPTWYPTLDLSTLDLDD